MGGEPRIPPAVLAAVTEAAVAIPPEIIATITQRLRQGPASLDRREDVLGVVGQDATRARLRKLLALWDAAYPGSTHEALAAALDAAATMHEWHRRNQSLELVWTGPVPSGTVLRRTDQALLELIRGARGRLLVVTFAAYRIPMLHQALIEAADRGVSLDFVLESKEESQGKVTVDPVRALGPELAKRATVWTWPLEARPRDARGRHGTLHVKCALADGSRLFISSANLTADALLLNMELGLLVEGGKLPLEVDGHFADLKAAGVLGRLRSPPVLS